MIKNSISIYYDNDANLGDYFNECGLRSNYILDRHADLVQTKITGPKCNTFYINDVELPKHTEPTLLIIYSHGSESEFSKANELPFFGGYPVIPECLKNGLVYSNACLVGSIFGEKIGADNSSFFGYNKTVSVFLDYKEDSLACDIHGLSQILKGKTLREAKEESKAKYNETMEKLPNLFASYLRQDRDSIVIHGDINSPFFPTL